MLRIGVGHCEGLDARAVLAAVVADARAQLGDAAPAAGLLTVSGDFDPELLAAELERALPGVPIVGTTTAGDLSSRLGVSEDSIGLLLFASDVIRFGAGLGERASQDPAAAAAQALAQARVGAGDEPVLCFVLPDSRFGGSQAQISALEAALPPGCAIFGGKLGGQWDRPAAPRAQFFAGRVVHDALPILLCAGPLRCEFRVIQGWTPVGPRQVAGGVDGNRVTRIGERTALEFYRHYFGAHARLVPELPLAVHAGEGGFYVRTPLASDEAEGWIAYGGEVPEGAEVQLAEAIRDVLLASTERALQDLRADVAAPGPDRAPHGLAAALVFSCAARKQILGTRTALELEAVTRALPEVPVFGFYAGGEVAPLVRGGAARLHNATMVILTLGTCSEGQVQAPAPTRRPDEPRLLLRKLQRADSYRVRAEDGKELVTAMQRTIGAEIDEARRRIAAQNDELRRTHDALAAEKARSDALLQNILPAEVAEELKRTGQVKPTYHDSVTVLFTDFKGFTRVASRLSPAALLRELDFHFSEFDRIVARHGLEKLKTIGDAYMCAGGIPAANATHAVDAVAAAWEISRFMLEVGAEKSARGEQPWELRIGVHTGPLMAGVIGHKKFAYDIWGDTVNIASRLESTGEAGRINVSRATYLAIRERFVCEHRGKLPAKNAGEIDMYFVVGPR